jgi:hypothetical protein
MDRHETGMKTRRAVLGDAHVDRADAATTEFDAPFQQMITEGAWGTLWSDDTIPLRERSKWAASPGIRRSARPAPRPSSARTSNGCRGCRAGRPCGRAAVVVEIALRGGLDRLAQHARLGVARLGEELEAFAQRAELAQAVPAQVVLLQAAARASGPSRRRRSRTGRRPASASRSTASWPRCPVRGSGTGRSGSRAARCR